MENTKIAVIGGGAGGVMAALRGTLNNDHVLLFPGAAAHRKKSRAQWVTKIENMPGYTEYKRAITQPHNNTIKEIEAGPFADKFEHFKNVGIDKIEKKGDLFELTDTKGNTHEVGYVILATGLMDVQPKIQGTIDTVFPYANIQLIDYCIRCDGHHTHKKNSVIIGHDTTALWVSIILYERYDLPKMTVLSNGETPSTDPTANKILQAYGIEVKTSPIASIQGVPKENTLEGFTLEDGTVIPAEMAFVSLGMIVYNELAVQLGLDIDDRGFVVTDTKGQSSIPGVYAVGDLRAGLKKQVYTAWDSAVDSMDHINGILRKKKREALMK